MAAPYPYSKAFIHVMAKLLRPSIYTPCSSSFGPGCPVSLLVSGLSPAVIHIQSLCLFLWKSFQAMKEHGPVNRDDEVALSQEIHCHRGGKVPLDPQKIMPPITFSKSLSMRYSPIHLRIDSELLTARPPNGASKGRLLRLTPWMPGRARWAGQSVLSCADHSE